jgi:hypothetical protein
VRRVLLRLVVRLSYRLGEKGQDRRNFLGGFVGRFGRCLNSVMRGGGLTGQDKKAGNPPV